jgi:hypothetical protein
VAAELDERDAVRGFDAACQFVIGQRCRNDRQRIVACRERKAQGCRGGGERRDAGHDHGLVPLGQALEQIHEGPVKKRIAETQCCDIATGVEMRADLTRGVVVDRQRGVTLDTHRHADGDLDLRAGQMRRHDGARQAVAGIGGEVGENRTGAREALRLQRH